MKTAMIGLFIAVALSVSIVHARETATYVGEGRYVGQDRTSSGSAVLRQRNQEQTERVRDRDRSEQRYEQVNAVNVPMSTSLPTGMTGINTGLSQQALRQQLHCLVSSFSSC